MELSTPTRCLQAFYRLVGSESDDDDLVERGEAADEVAYTFLTRGFRRAQHFLLDAGLKGWRTRSSALTWSGTDAVDGGRYSALPADFLRADGDRSGRSALVEADGTAWGQEVSAQDDGRQGDYYYLTATQVWLARTASPPTTLYLRYVKKHPAFSGSMADADLILPVDCNALGVAYAAAFAREDSWLPGGVEMEAKIERAVTSAQAEARGFARTSREPQTFQAPKRHGHRW